MYLYYMVLLLVRNVECAKYDDTEDRTIVRFLFSHANKTHTICNRLVFVVGRVLW